MQFDKCEPSESTLPHYRQLALSGAEGFDKREASPVRHDLLLGMGAPIVTADAPGPPVLRNGGVHVSRETTSARRLPNEKGRTRGPAPMDSPGLSQAPGG